MIIFKLFDMSPQQNVQHKMRSYVAGRSNLLILYIYFLFVVIAISTDKHATILLAQGG